jgi:hypothetical protein
MKAGVANKVSLAPTGYPVLPVPAGVLGANANPGMRIIVTGTLPPGVTFTDLNEMGMVSGVGTFSGTPAASSAGNYTLTVTAHNGYGAPVKTITLQVTP